MGSPDGLQTKVANRQQGLQTVYAASKCLRAPLQTIDDRHNSPHLKTGGLGFFDGCQRTVSGGDRIFDDNRRFAGQDGAFPTPVG